MPLINDLNQPELLVIDVSYFRSTQLKNKQTNSETIPFGAVHTGLALIREGPSPKGMTGLIVKFRIRSINLPLLNIL